MNSLPVWFIKLCIHVVSLVPLFWLYYQAFNDGLGADPVKAIIHFTGIGAFNLLIVTLLVSPLSRWLKNGKLQQCRRLVGLYAFTYALLHLVNFIAFDLQFDIALLLSEIIKRPYITVGMLAMLIITALAVTSPQIIKRKLGKKWQQLHNWTYPLALLIAVHFYWSVKSELIEPSVYFAIVLALLYWRKQRIQRWLNL